MNGKEYTYSVKWLRIVQKQTHIRLTAYTRVLKQRYTGFKATAQHTEYQRITRTVSVKSTFRATGKALPSHRKGSMSA